MPSVSRKQQRYLYAKFGSDWVHAHHFDVLDTSRALKRRKRKKAAHAVRRSR